MASSVDFNIWKKYFEINNDNDLYSQLIAENSQLKSTLQCQEKLQTRIRDLEMKLSMADSEIQYFTKMFSKELWITICNFDVNECPFDNCQHPAHFHHTHEYAEIYITASKFESCHEKHVPVYNGKYYKLCGRVNHDICLRNKNREVRIWTNEWI